jgi:hypothetical protein
LRFSVVRADSLYGESDDFTHAVSRRGVLSVRALCRGDSLHPARVDRHG